MFCLYPTSPLRKARDLCLMYDLLLRCPSANGAIAVTKFSHYPFQAMYVGENNFLNALWPEHILKKGNEFPQLYAGNGSTYAIQVSEFIANKNFLPLDSGLLPYAMNSLSSIDIDDSNDYELLCKITKLVNDELVLI